MTGWEAIRSVPVGGVVAVGFLDEDRIVVGSHSGLGVFDARSGTRLDRVEDVDGDYAWFRESPPAAVYTDVAGEHLVAVAGLWGGTLSAKTHDGWSCRAVSTGAVLSGPAGVEISVDDDEEPMACGFSPLGQVFVFATSPTLHVAVRSSA